MRERDHTHLNPPLLAQFREWRCLLELGFFLRDRKLLLASCHKGDGLPVIVIPGFLAGDTATAVLRAFLVAMGYVTYGWQQGLNLGPTPVIMTRLLAQVRVLHRQHRRKVTLIGWSLGGLYARELARLSPHDVRMVVTLGSPLRGSPASSQLWAMFKLLNWRNLPALSAVRLADRCRPLPVRSVALYSRSDGVVNWPCCTAPRSRRSRNVEVQSSHIGMVYSTDALRCIAEQIA